MLGGGNVSDAGQGMAVRAPGGGPMICSTATAVVAFATAAAAVLVVRRHGKVALLAESVRQREAKLAQEQRIANVGSWEWDVAARTLSWSDQVYRILGIDRGGFDGAPSSFLNYVHPRDRGPLHEATVRAVKERAPYTVEHRVIRPDGEVRTVLEQGEVICDDAGTPVRVIGTVQDITERTRAAEALKASEERFRTTFEQAGIGIAHISLGGRFLRANGKLCGITGYSLDELLALDFREIVHPDDIAEEEARLNEVAACGVGIPVAERRYVRRDGSVMWVNATIAMCQAGNGEAGGGAGYFVAVIEDITDRKRADNELRQLRDELELRVQERTRDLQSEILVRRQAEESMQKSEERLRLVLDAVVDGIITIDEGGIVKDVNPAAERIFGYGRAEMIGRNVSMLMPEPYRSEHDSYMARYLATSEPHIIGSGREVRGLRKDGSTFPLDLAVSELAQDGQRLFTGVIRDITERKAANAALQQAKEQAEAANLAKSKFLSGVSHELRTPMNAVLGFSQLLAANPKEPLSVKQAEYTDHIIKSGLHLLDLINEILDLAKVESGTLSLSIENVDPGAVLGECLVLVQPMATKAGIAIHDRASGTSMPLVEADYTRLKQVLLNLLSNAIKYNLPDGSVTITTALETPGLLRLTVADTGKGIPDHLADDVFRPFTRLQHETSEIEGTGIGLAITKQLVELMGGEIGYASRIGEGTSFWIEIPLADETGAAARAEGRGKGGGGLAALPRGEHTLLYVEDNVANVALMAELAAQIPNLTLLAAREGTHGLELARIHKPDVILLDINLPGMDGYAILERLQKDPETRDIPTLALSANAMPSDVERGREAGFFSYLTKPLDIGKLLQALGAALVHAGKGGGP